MAPKRRSSKKKAKKAKAAKPRCMKGASCCIQKSTGRRSYRSSAGKRIPYSRVCPSDRTAPCTGYCIVKRRGKAVAVPVVLPPGIMGLPPAFM